MATNTSKPNTTTAIDPNNKFAKGALAVGTIGSALTAGIQMFDDSQSNLPGVSGIQKAQASRQNILAGRLGTIQGLPDTSYNRIEKTLAEQSAGILANVTNQAREMIMMSPLALEAMVKQATEKATSLQQTGMEKLGIYDVETVLNNAKMAVQAASLSHESQMKITEQEREIETQRRKIDEARNENFRKSMTNLAKVFESVFSGWGGDGTQSRDGEMSSNPNYVAPPPRDSNNKGEDAPMDSNKMVEEPDLVFPERSTEDVVNELNAIANKRTGESLFNIPSNNAFGKDFSFSNDGFDALKSLTTEEVDSLEEFFKKRGY